MDPLTADMLAETLQEPKKSLLAKVLRTLGQERCQTIFADTLTIESTGGMLTRAGDRRRSPGGTFFHLVRQQCSKQERARLFPYPSTKKPQQPQPAPALAPLTLTLDHWRRPHRLSLTPHPCYSPSTTGKDLLLCLSLPP